jgi:hypothetical protein
MDKCKNQKPNLNSTALFNDFVKSLEMIFSVIPAKAGIQSFQTAIILWTPVFIGVTIFYEFITI